MKLKKTIAVVLAAVCASTMFGGCLTANADMTPNELDTLEQQLNTTVTPGSGQCGENAHWAVSEDGTLTISGSGGLYDYYHDEKKPLPWFENNDAAVITRFVVEDGIEDLTGGAFFGMSIPSLELPDSVKAFGESAFGSCLKLETAVLPDGISEIPRGAFNCCSLLETVVLPDGLKTINTSSFRHCNSLKNIVIPKTVTEIKANAFYDCTDLEEVIIPDSVKAIEHGTFDMCTSLRKLIFPQGLEKIYDAAFSGCANLRMVILPDGLTEIGSDAFSYDVRDRDDGEPVMEIYVPQSVNKIGKRAINPETVIYGFKNSAAEKYAKENRNEFVAVSESMYGAEGLDKSNEDYYTKDLLNQSSTIEISGRGLVTKIDGIRVDYHGTLPFVDTQNRTQVPIRAIAQMLGCTVDWNSETRTVKITSKDGDNITFKIDSDVMMKNDTPVQMDTAALIWNERTYVPLRFAAEAFGRTVQWIE